MSPDSKSDEDERPDWMDPELNPDSMQEIMLFSPERMARSRDGDGDGYPFERLSDGGFTLKIPINSEELRNIERDNYEGFLEEDSDVFIVAKNDDQYHEYGFISNIEEMDDEWLITAGAFTHPPADPSVTPVMKLGFDY